MVRAFTLAAFVAAAAIVAGACSTNPSTAPTSTPVLGTISALTVSGTAPTVGSAVQFKAIAMLTDGSSQDVTNSVTWQTSNAADATVTKTGIVNGVAGGTVTITASLGSMTATDQITIAS